MAGCVVFRQTATVAKVYLFFETPVEILGKMVVNFRRSPMANPKILKQEYCPHAQYWEPKYTPEGYVLSAEPPQSSSWAAMGCAGLFITAWLGIWCGVSFTMFAIALGQLLRGPTLGSILMFLFITPFVAIGVGGLIWVGRILYQKYRIQDGVIILPTYPLYAGETYRVRYRRPLRNGRTTETAAMAATWLHYEWVQYYRGTDLTTITHELTRNICAERTVSRGAKQLDYATDLTIPPDATPSIYAPNHNQLRWEFQVHCHLPGVVRDTSFFKLKVVSRP
ncbi:hypothetical protein FLX56_23075 [Synechococcus moorigangaii CMS01]|nr:hypothetical protein [Synechococcus moorigangaii CMS01]